MSGLLSFCVVFRCLVLCCVVLRCVVLLCCVVWCCVVCYVVLCCVALCCVALCCVVLCGVVLCCVALCCGVSSCLDPVPVHEDWSLFSDMFVPMGCLLQRLQSNHGSILTYRLVYHRRRGGRRQLLPHSYRDDHHDQVIFPLDQTRPGLPSHSTTRGNASSDIDGP